MHIDFYLTYYLRADWKMLYHLLYFTYAFSSFCQKNFQYCINLLIAYLRGKGYNSLHKWVLKYLKPVIFLSLLSCMWKKSAVKNIVGEKRLQ